MAQAWSEPHPDRVVVDVDPDQTQIWLVLDPGRDVALDLPTDLGIGDDFVFGYREGSGEAYQLALSGEGIVIVQASEGHPKPAKT